MSHSYFVIWILGFSFSVDIGIYLRFLQGKKELTQSEKVWLLFVEVIIAAIL